MLSAQPRFEGQGVLYPRVCPAHVRPAESTGQVVVGDYTFPFIRHAASAGERRFWKCSRADPGFFPRICRCLRCSSLLDRDIELAAVQACCRRRRAYCRNFRRVRRRENSARALLNRCAFILICGGLRYRAFLQRLYERRLIPILLFRRASIFARIILLVGNPSRHRRL